MSWQDWVLLAAGPLGGGVAVFHGILTQKLMVRPLGKLLAIQPGTPVSIRRLVPLLLHFSTFCWLLGGAYLVILAFGVDFGARTAVCVLIGIIYAYGVVGNYWATRGRHPGWMLLGFAVLLIGVGAIR